jgi:hypothetical protein
MELKSVAAVALCVPLLVIGVAGTASAGEVKGPPSGTGEPGGPKANGDGFATGGDSPTGPNTPIADWVAGSICSFSGLNQFHPGKPVDVWPQVQSFGMGVSADGYAAQEETPGVECVGYAADPQRP